MSPEQIMTPIHYERIIGGAQGGRVVAIYFYDDMAPPCWDITVVFREAAADPAYQRAQFFLFNTSTQELSDIMETVPVGFVPLFAFFKDGEKHVEVPNGSREQARAIIAEYCA